MSVVNEQSVSKRLPSEAGQANAKMQEKKAILGQFLQNIVVLGGAYILGMFGFSPSWLLMGVLLWMAHENYLNDKIICTALHHSVANNEKGVVSAKFGDLPTWVYFPDTERAEWLNKIIRQMWPYVGHYVQSLFREKVEPAVRANLPPNLQSFKFEKIVLGDMPPRIGGIKVYHENVARDEIIMDVEILYSGDCRFSVRAKGLTAGIKDIQLHGVMRVEMKPLVKQIPLIGGVNVFFLIPPAIDFNMTNLADILNLPVLSDILRRNVIGQITALMVFPNKFTISLTEDIPVRLLKFLQPAGVLYIEVLEARKLKNADICSASDPYAIITVGAFKSKTIVITNCNNPVWNHQCEAVVSHVEGLTLDIEVMDEDKDSKDDFLGRISVNISSIITSGKVDTWYTLEEAKTGEIHLKITWLTFTDNLSDINPVMNMNIPHFSSSLLMVFVDSATDLPVVSRIAGEPNPQVNLKIAAHSRLTAVRLRTSKPVWEENFSFLLQNPQTDELKIEVRDAKSEKSLGNCSLQVSQLLKEPDHRLDQPFLLQRSGPGGKIFLMLQLKVLKYSDPHIKEGAVTADKEIHTKRAEEVSVDKLNSVESALPKRMNNADQTTSSISDILRNKFDFRSGVVCENEDLCVKVSVLSESFPEQKQKTHFLRGAASLVFDKALEFDMMTTDHSNFQLKIVLKTRGGGRLFSRGRVLGQNSIELHFDLNKAITNWYDCVFSNVSQVLSVSDVEALSWVILRSVSHV
ncbi:extended synaptotagmin-2-like, partial [Limulus polyphemus]|uniref:Extended synaptotagmin-2-like n=1 Tax=Limulus polyphemus TaxID=6850 RepID=A0ABM1TPU5_LIMPO